MSKFNRLFHSIISESFNRFEETKTFTFEQQVPITSMKINELNVSTFILEKLNPVANIYVQYRSSGILDENTLEVINSNLQIYFQIEGISDKQIIDKFVNSISTSKPMITFTTDISNEITGIFETIPSKTEIGFNLIGNTNELITKYFKDTLLEYAGDPSNSNWKL